MANKNREQDAPKSDDYLVKGKPESGGANFQEKTHLGEPSRKLPRQKGKE